MQCAVVLALGDPRSSDAATWIDAVAWLRQELAERGFRVSVIDGEDVESDLSHALEGVTRQDDVFVHLSGRLVGRGVVRTAGGRRVRLQTLADAIAAQAGPDVSLFAELLHDDGANDMRAATEHVASIVADVGAHARGYALVAAVRPASAAVEGLALTRLFIDVARTAAPYEGFVSSAVYERIANAPEGRARAQHFAFVRGASDRPPRSSTFRPLPSFASEPLPSFESEPLPSFGSDPLPSFESDPLPSFAPEPLPSFAFEPLPSFAPEPLPSFAFEPLPSFAPEPLPSFAPEPLPSFAPEPQPSFAPEPLPSFEAAPAPVSGPDLSLDEQIAEATAAGDSRRVVKLRRERLRTIESGRLRVRELVSIARVLQVELADAPAAIEALEEARAIDPTRVGVMQALRRGYERRGSWEQAFEVMGALADLSPSATDRAELRVAQAQVALDQLHDHDGALALLQKALENDPNHERALAVFDALHALRPRTVDAAEALGSVDGSDDWENPRVANAVPDVTPRQDTAPHTASNDDALDEASPQQASPDPASPQQASPQQASPDQASPDQASPQQASPQQASPQQASPDQASASVSVESDALAYSEVAEGELLAEASASELASDELVEDPADPSIHASAFASHWREGRTDAAFLAALALEELGAADVDQQILVDQFRSVAPIRARGMLDESAWDLLRATGPRDAVAALFAGVARAAVAMRLEDLTARKGLVTLDPTTRLDEKSTASIVRSFQWAARVLGVPCPALYVIDDVPGDIAAVRAPEPSTALGPSVLRGRSAKELAFLAGRHLTYYRAEHQVLVYFPTGEDLTRLLLATIEIGAPGTLPDGGDDAVGALREGLLRQLTRAEHTAIAIASRQLDGKVDLGGWARGIEVTAGRAGLLLCGDLATAASLVRSESRPIGGLTPDDRRHDLISFVVSPEHRQLRARYVVSAPGDTQPPAPGARASAALQIP